MSNERAYNNNWILEHLFEKNNKTKKKRKKTIDNCHNNSIELLIEELQFKLLNK